MSISEKVMLIIFISIMIGFIGDHLIHKAFNCFKDVFKPPLPPMPPDLYGSNPQRQQHNNDARIGHAFDFDDDSKNKEPAKKLALTLIDDEDIPF